MLEVVTTLVGSTNEIASTGLESLIGANVSPHFFSDVFNKEILYVKHSSPAYFESYLKKDQLSDLLAYRHIAMGDLRMAREGQKVSLYELLNEESNLIDVVRGKIEQGYTLILQQLNQYHAPLTKLISSLEVENLFAFQANAYYSPPNSLGFERHWDTHDVFILQVEGEKVWELFDRPIMSPNDELTSKYSAKLSSQAKFIQKVMLKPGELLYLPRGAVHQVYTEDSDSLHITLGIRQSTVENLLMKSISQICKNEPAFQRSLNFLTDDTNQTAIKERLIEHLNSYNLTESLNKIRIMFLDARRQAQSRLLSNLFAKEQSIWQPETKYSISASYRTEFNGDFCHLYFEGRKLSFPSLYKTELSHILQNKSTTFDIKKLEKERLDYIGQKLLNEGLLQLAK
ncbi:hypothetical protein CWC05_01260 [Pseudoalteromonas ruthenica]|uniref:JmjC domain-containing protein n=1 Tax=Pseudoalteromonas ruthenica TaxID=151081 RepID=A0A5S3Z9T4_9GAMM|nr:cupin domain-containing protein [Pseudoalteromonas ruthenica]TMP89012.1 hypothetical protein CWC05_01260 [Pseudoalteromonas ruthenica]